MNHDQFYISLNRVYSLMFENKLRSDLDDSLLEKLLSLVKNGMQEQINGCNSNFSTQIDFIEEMLKHTQVLPLAERVVLSLLPHNSIKLSSSIKVFTLRLVGLIFENGNIFTSPKFSSLLQEFSRTLNDGSLSLPSSTQDAVLSCLFSIGKHPEGALWLIQEKLLDYGYSCFSSASYYVRKTATVSFAEALALWTSSGFSTLPEPQSTIINHAVEEIILRIMSGIQLSAKSKETHLTNCCILTLKQALETSNIKKIVYKNFHFIEKVKTDFRNISKYVLINESVFDLLLVIYSRDTSKEDLIKEILEILISHQKFVYAIKMTSSVIGISAKHTPLKNADLQLFFLPLLVLNGNVKVDDSGSAFHISSSTCGSLINELGNKSMCIEITTSSISTLTKLTEFMDESIIEDVLKSVEVIVKGPTTEQSHPMSYLFLDNRKIQLAVLELFSCLLSEKIYGTMNFESHLKLMEYLLCLLERPSSDSNIVSKVLRLSKCQVALIVEHDSDISLDIKDQLLMCLSRKLLDNKEPVVDSALQLAGQILNPNGNKLWRKVSIKHHIHLIVWEIAIEGRNEGFVKASALRVAIEAALNPCYWEEIKSRKKVNVVDVLEILCNYFHSPDFFIQRESLTCIFKWFQSNGDMLSKRSHQIFSILFCAIKSLDLELKLTALQMWEWLMDSNSICDIAKSCDIGKYVQTLFDIGFVACILNAIEDYDEVVKFNAAGILLKYKQKLLLMGITVDSLNVKDLKLETNASTAKEYSIILPISTAERDAGIETVLNISTTEHLANLYCSTLEESFQNSCHCQDFLNVTAPGSLTVESFWNNIWNGKLESILTPATKSSTVFSEHCLSLLDDIIAAEVTEIYNCMDDGLDCY